MRPPSVFVRVLVPEEGNRLKRLSRRAASEAKRERALIVWASATRMPVSQIATLVGTDESHVRKVVVEATGRWRAEIGEVHVWDPGAPDSACWTPLDRCDQWGYALRQGLWLADAVGHGDHQAARFWNAEAAKLLAPLLHAAALGPAHMEAVIGWLDDREIDGGCQTNCVGACG